MWQLVNSDIGAYHHPSSRVFCLTLCLFMNSGVKAASHLSESGRSSSLVVRRLDLITLLSLEVHYVFEITLKAVL